MRHAAAVAITTMLVLAGGGKAQAVVLSDDFEADTVGTFPAQWQDVALLDPSSPVPSAGVVSTTDAFGAPTRAVRIDDFLADSQGFFQDIPISQSVRIDVDVRIDQFSDNSISATQDWPIDITLTQNTGGAFPFVPSMGIFVSSLTQTWQSFIVGTNGTILVEDYFTPVALGTWYHVELDLDTVNGIMTSQITDIGSGSLLLTRTDVVPGWTPADGLFDAVSFFDGELAVNATQGNITFVDNVFVSAKVPEPTSLALLALGLSALGFKLKRDRSL